MEQIQSIEQLRILQSEVREKKKGFLTNFYLDEFKHGIWISKGDLFFEWIEDSVFFIKKSTTFWNVFYTSANLVEFEESLRLFKTQYASEQLIFDIVGREKQCTELLVVFQRQGFSEATSLVRMTKITEVMTNVARNGISYATLDEVKTINELLHNYFDEKLEQIPYIDELEEYARRKNILVCKEENRIAGFLIFELSASTLYLRYWFTHPDFRDKKVGSRLLRNFFEIGNETKRQLFWVIRSNENAIVRYRHYGFAEENMFDYVMSNR
ncbi:MAG: GNAT family N-acetyltransferase [Bacteroidales bacterium]|nr:GNAT family N-acetyltransferase [Bacteroidales bacterium]